MDLGRFVAYAPGRYSAGMQDYEVRILCMVIGAPLARMTWKTLTRAFDRHKESIGEFWCEETRSWRKKPGGPLQRHPNTGTDKPRLGISP
jgi:hypothetical protein